MRVRVLGRFSGVVLLCPQMVEAGHGVLPTDVALGDEASSSLDDFRRAMLPRFLLAQFVVLGFGALGPATGPVLRGVFDRGASIALVHALSLVPLAAAAARLFVYSSFRRPMDASPSTLSEASRSPLVLA